MAANSDRRQVRNKGAGVVGKGKGKGKGKGDVVRGKGAGVLGKGKGKSVLIEGKGKGAVIRGKGKAAVVGGKGKAAVVGGKAIVIGGKGKTVVGGKGKAVGIGGKGKAVGVGGKGRGDGRKDIWEIRDEDSGSGSDFEDEEIDEEIDEESDEESDEEVESDEEMEEGDEEMEGEEEMEVEEEDGDEVPTYVRARRNVCYGDYKKPPKDGAPKLGVVEFIDEKTIKQPKYKRTLKGILRAEWKYETAFEKGQRREIFLNKCVRKFRKYYTYPAGYSRKAGDSVVKEHLRRNMKQNMFTMKRDANKMVAEAVERGEKDVKRHMFKPHFLKEDAWRGCCDYWETDGFKKMSGTNTENRKLLKFAHASGAMPFEERRITKEKESGELMSALELFNLVYTKKHEELIKIKEALERATLELDSQSTDEPPLSPKSRKRKNILITLKARKPKKGRVFMHSRHSLQELLGPEEAATFTNLSTPARIPEHAYEMMTRALNEVTDMVQAMDGMDEVPRSHLDEELKKLADVAYPSKDDPIQQVLWDQYIKIAANLATSLFGRFKKVIIEDSRPMEHDEDEQENMNRQENGRNDQETMDGQSGQENMDGQSGQENGQSGQDNSDAEGSYNNTQLSP